ncbi:AAA domain-containing protein [Luteolibacter pohnpeiensis]|uniref:AAA domain-containing protein n=1 Tax=Luteolibacter pohnpeiensis TaxID=454153 RepID=UPI001F301D69|nr:AAA domain-containing protein [Luteolibacter pohnpeiensis]
MENATSGGRRKIIQNHLRDRLFEVSRRNRLLYFKSSQSTLNLTTASVPLVLDYRNIKEDQLLFWHHHLEGEVKSGRSIPLQKWLRLEDAPYLPGQLDKLISDARRSRAEYGFSQLRLVVVFLRWNNLKESPQERIHSPLLLMPVNLVKRKGVKDQYILEPQGTELEINPALRHQLHQLYDVELPDQIDLRETTIADFHESLRGLIQKTEPGVLLDLCDKPRIQLIHEKASKRLDQYRRRMEKKRKAVATRADDLAYSYDRSDFRPLGLQMFQKMVVPSPLPLRELAGAPPRPRTPFLASPDQHEAQHYALIQEAEGNPYSWEFDLCALTLANFNYRKMTLVRDYANLIEHNTSGKAFDQLFSIDPKTVDVSSPVPLKPSDQYLIISADATQVSAIAKARHGESLIIQGPPGTGKSQTITNLIADYVARGKRVLFVCEKRAAIDVVFHRLRQQGLDELCCLIHDSQTDKKEFVMNLKQTYEGWLAGNTVSGSSPKRDAALRTMETELGLLQNYMEQLNSVPGEAGVPLREILLRLIQLRGSQDGSACPALTAEQEERLPHYGEWVKFGDTVERLNAVLLDLGVDPIFARHPLRHLGEDVIHSDSPLDGCMDRLGAVERQLDDLLDALQRTGLPQEDWNSFERISQLLDFSQRLQPIASRDQINLLDPESPRSKEWSKLKIDHTKALKELETAQKKTSKWRVKLSAEETLAALELAKRVHGTFGFLNPGWWRLRKVLKSNYDFSTHAIAPTWEQILTDLAAEHAAIAIVDELSDQSLTKFGEKDPQAFASRLAELTDPSAPSAISEFRSSLLSTQQSTKLVNELAALAAGFQMLRKEVDSLIFDASGMDLEDVSSAIRGICEELDTLPELLPTLCELSAASDKMRRSIREFDLISNQLEAAYARKTLESFYQTDRHIQRFDSRVLQQKMDRLSRVHNEWLHQNVHWILDQVRQRFLEHVQISTQSATALSPELKLFKKSYSAGRREVEHEFGKTMRYKSIRDLAAGDTGQVVRDLKPIWLMSPLSVSDTLPLDTGLFDVVIFDEASQIPVEDAIPAAYRAEQVIVVGDEMQLPPTNFFGSADGDEEDEISIDEDGETVSIMMDADSFLTQSTRSLPSTLLAWHYRSRYEALIGFSNAAFYKGELFTIPDRQISVAQREKLQVDSVDEMTDLVPEILARPISFVHCPNGVYGNRRNSVEAAVVARLVHDLLVCESNLSIGVAAFSEAQQDEIESALNAIAAVDSDFANRLEAEYAREEDDQFCGLFVKNLENIQGDERDIILMSVCYAPESEGRMRMNFGPINQRGGEKRLNVIFSRARHHMVLVSSIRYTQITNDYNDGARALKNFLQYAEGQSNGDVATARLVLDGLNPLKNKTHTKEYTNHFVAAQIAAALEMRGWIADTSVGQGRFRCDIAIRAADEERYQIAILIDRGTLGSAMEQFHTRPGILRAFGWGVVVVMIKDWWHEPEAILQRIERALHKEETPEELELHKEIPLEESFLETGISEPQNTTPDALRRFEFTAGTSHKFWSINQIGCSIRLNYGRIGSSGQARVKEFSNESRAALEVEKLVAEKLAKGYVEVI